VLPGIPTIRVFEALACGAALVSAPWSDSERLFAPGDFAVARDGTGMARRMSELLDNPGQRAMQVRSGLASITARHTCAHRVDELLGICAELGVESTRVESAGEKMVPEETAA
jgi:spore maturation protein CgeB